MPMMLEFSLMLKARGSIIKANTIDYSGHPCLFPFNIGNLLDNNPELYTQAEGTE